MHRTYDQQIMLPLSNYSKKKTSSSRSNNAKTRIIVF
jgi:hypothetical protein